MSNDNQDDQAGRGKNGGGASPLHRASSGERLAPVITLHHHTDTPTTDTPTTDTHSTTGPGGPVVVEGEVVGEVISSPTGTTQRSTAVTTRRRLYCYDVTTAGRHTVAAATSTTAVSTAKGLVRHTYYVLSGTGVLWTRWRDTHGPTRYERQMRAAEAACDHDRLLEWEARDTAEKQRRHTRVMDWINAPLAWLRAAGTAALGVLGVLVGLGMILAIAAKDISLVIAPITGVIDTIAWTIMFVTVYSSLLGTLALTGAVAGLWALGRARTEPPAWVAPPADDEPASRDVIPDERAVVNALRHLGLTALNSKFKAGWAPRWILPPVHDGKGWHCQFLLPEGVTVKMINDKKPVLAHNLLRLPVEVWPTEPRDHPGVLDLWVADQGSLTRPVGDWPLLHKGTTDYFTGVPTAIDPRGNLVTARLFAANWGVAGMMGSGKSGLIITTLAGAVLDPLVEIDIYCMAHNADYDPFAPVARTLHVSDDPDDLPTVLDGLTTLLSELSERGRKLSAAGEPKLTRTLAAADPTMRPRVVVIDECQELFISPAGEQAAELVTKIVAKGRKYGVTLIFATPVPSADSLPRGVAKVLSNRACFAIADHQGNDAILGTGKHTAGITATGLRPATTNPDGSIDPGDIGTAMTSGFTPADGLIRCHHIDRGNGTDHLTPIIDRALALRRDTGLDTSTGTGTTTPPVPRRDLLDDLLHVMTGHTRMRTQEALALLAALDRAHYGTWTFERLTDELPDGAKPYKTGGTKQISADRIHEARTDRQTVTHSDEHGEWGHPPN